MTNALVLYRALVDMGSQPALTWYSSQGRMELSGTVVANHCAKIAGFLADEAWAEPGETARLSLPCHWKSVLWALGAMLAGLHVEIAEGDEISQTAVLITNHPEKKEERDAAREVVALDMNPLTFGWTGADLPPGVLDGSAGQLSQPDVLLDTRRQLSSNFGRWIGGTLTDEQRALFISTSLSQILHCACIQFLRGGSLVVAPPQCTVPAAEKAKRVNFKS